LIIHNIPTCPITSSTAIVHAIAAFSPIAAVPAPFHSNDKYRIPSIDDGPGAWNYYLQKLSKRCKKSICFTFFLKNPQKVFTFY